MQLLAQSGPPPMHAQPPVDAYNTAVPTYAQTQWREAPGPVPAQPYTTHTGYNSQTEPRLPVQQAPQPSQPVQRQPRGLRTGAILLLTALLALVFGTGLFAGWQFGRGGTTAPVITTTQSSSIPATTSGSSTEAAREAVVAKVTPAIVLVTVTTANGTALGSGEIVNKQGYIVTNNHVVSGATAIQVTLSNGTRATAQLTGTDPADDLAVIKITPPSSNLAVITIGDSSQLKVGQDVLAIGNPLGNTQTVTNGIVSALNRSVSEGQGGATIPDAIQTDAPINPGNSGGALVDMQGNLVGIPTLT
ncbi:MAG: trypsin-like peptidase domain-containing protein, partial [Ktedonobacteraceae bacterium]|nr:trypsin-like peptidase domain-containing protein [Ktedonobacteraceae bacterium]